MKKITPQKLSEKKENEEKIVFSTAYDYPTSKILEKIEIDGALVGDSLGNTVLGYENTLPVTMDEMLHHTKAVARGLENPLLVSDMPFMSYQQSEEKAVENAGKFLKEGKAEAVKVEGGSEHLEKIQNIIDAGIPVMGHLGLTPQRIKQFGGYAPRGKSKKEAKKIYEDAKKLEDIGVFSLVLESIPSKLAKKITEELEIPTIGIGAGPDCDGQILVFHDLIGLSDFSPKFVKNYADVSSTIEDALKDFKSDVKKENFPNSEHSYEIDEDLKDFIDEIGENSG